MYQLPALKYQPNQLEGFLSETTVNTHYGKHHQNYLNKLNELVAGADYAAWPIEQLIARVNELPEAIRQGVINNGGGYFNHNVYWETLTPVVDGRPEGELLTLIEQKYGSFEQLAEQFQTKAAQVFGSGWLWLMPDLSLVASANQDNPLSTTGQIPLTGIDVWEHAYYLDYKNLRPEYIDQWWRHLDWAVITERWQQSRQS